MEQSLFYQDIHARNAKAFLIKYPHYALPNLNIRKDEDLEREIYAPYQYTKPVPYLPPASVSVEVWSGSDPAVDLVKKKLQWKHEVDVQKQYYKRTKRKVDLCKTFKSLISSEKRVWSASARESHFVELVATNPDKEFDGTYNWYYTGGCLDVMQMNGTHMLLTTQGHKNDRLRVLQLKKKKKYWKRVLSSAVTQLCTPDKPIYQIRGSCNTGYVCVRQRNDCQLYSLTQEMELQRVHSTECDSAFTGMDLSPHTAGTYATVTSRRCIKEWDASGRNIYRRMVGIDETLVDKWASVSYGDDPHGLVMADRSYVYMFDKRLKKRKSCKTLSPKDEIEIMGYCEDLCLAFPSCVNTHAWYICSSHTVLLYDTRSSSKPLQYWTHLLYSPPLLYTTVSPQQNEEIICIANQDPGEVVTIINKWNGEESHIQSYAMGLPNLRDSLLAGNVCGMWLDPAVQHRAKLSLTGLDWLPPVESNFTLLSQTSVGDVFSQRQKANSDSKSVTGFTKQRDLKCLANWEKVLLQERTSAALNVTSIKSMKNVFKYVKSSRNRLPEYQMLEKSKCQPWEMSKAQLESYVDLLAPRILEVWEIEDVPEWGESMKKSSTPQMFTEKEDQVQEWLTSIPNSSCSKTPSKDEKLPPLSTSTPYEQKNKDTKHTLDMNKSFSQVEEKCNESSDFDLTVSQSKKRKIAPKNKYTSGF